MSKPVASYLVRVHLRPAEDEQAPVTPPTLVEIETLVRVAITDATRSVVTVKAERVDE